MAAVDLHFCRNVAKHHHKCTQLEAFFETIIHLIWDVPDVATVRGLYRCIRAKNNHVTVAKGGLILSE